MCIDNKPLTVWVKLVLLVVNSVELHLTAYKITEENKVQSLGYHTEFNFNFTTLYESKHRGLDDQLIVCCNVNLSSDGSSSSQVGS